MSGRLSTLLAYMTFSVKATVPYQVFPSFFIFIFQQDDIDDVVNTWNRHLIRPSRNARVPSGRPNIMYFVPGLYATTDSLCNVFPERVEIAREECRFRKAIPCDEDVHELCCAVMKENGLEFPEDSDSAVNLYMELRRSISGLF